MSKLKWCFEASLPNIWSSKISGLICWSFQHNHQQPPARVMKCASSMMRSCSPISRACPQWVGQFNHPSPILTVGMFKVWKQCDSVVSTSLSMDNNMNILNGCGIFHKVAWGQLLIFGLCSPKKWCSCAPLELSKNCFFGIIGVCFHWISWVGLSAFKKLVMQLPFLCELFLFNVYCQLSNDEKWPWTIPTALVHIILESLQHRMGWIFTYLA